MYTHAIIMIYNLILCIYTNRYTLLLIIRANHSSCPHRRPPHARTPKNTVFSGTKCTCPGSWLSSCNAQLSNLCVECYIIIIIIIIINIIIIIVIIIILTILIIRIIYHNQNHHHHHHHHHHHQHHHHHHCHHCHHSV